MAKSDDKRHGYNGPDNHSLHVRRPFTLNIGTIIFGALFIYLLVSLILYLTANHVISYQVTSGPLAQNQVYSALIIRSEMIIKSDSSGYVSYYARENSKLKKTVPGFQPVIRFEQGAQKVLDNVLAHPELQKEDPDFDRFSDRVIAALEKAKKELLENA